MRNESIIFYFKPEKSLHRPRVGTGGTVYLPGVGFVRWVVASGGAEYSLAHAKLQAGESVMNTHALWSAKKRRA